MDIRTWIAASHRERLAFWATWALAYALLAFLAGVHGVGFTWTLVPTDDPSTFLAVPAYNPILWAPATFGADPHGPSAWANAAYWLILAGLAAVAAGRLVRRLAPGPGRPARVRRRAPDPGPGLPGPGPEAVAPTRAPAARGSER